MAYKQIDQYMTFADMAIENHASKNRTLNFLKELDSSIDWNPIEVLLKKNYEPGKSKDGEPAYQPLLLFKCFLLQKWFRIKSDPELESQINDRISFKVFLKIPMDTPSPDYSTFSRFRNRLSKQTMIEINSLLLKQLNGRGISINKGVTVDARLVKSASKPISNKKIKELEQHIEENGNLNKNGKEKKFSRDLESDWTVKNDKPHYGLKEHAAVDTDNGFILSTLLTPASHGDSTYLPYAVSFSMHTPEKIEKVYADKGYTGFPNRNFLSGNFILDGIMRKNNINASLTDFEIERNKSISKVRYIVEQYFGISSLHDTAGRARFPDMMKNTIDAMFRQFAYNLKKGNKVLKVSTA